MNKRAFLIVVDTGMDRKTGRAPECPSVFCFTCFFVVKQPPEDARPLRARSHKRVTLTTVRFFTTEATIKIKHVRREELIAKTYILADGR